MMSGDRFKFLVAVHAFFIKDNQVLWLRRANTGYMDGYLSVPAGHVDGGESIEMAMAREIYEEVGIEFDKPLEPSLVLHRRVSETEERIDYFFKVEAWDGTPENTEPHKCSGLEWHPVDALPAKIVPYVRFALSELLAGKHFTEFNEMK